MMLDAANLLGTLCTVVGMVLFAVTCRLYPRTIEELRPIRYLLLSLLWILGMTMLLADVLGYCSTLAPWLLDRRSFVVTRRLAVRGGYVLSAITALSLTLRWLQRRMRGRE